MPYVALRSGPCAPITMSGYVFQPTPVEQLSKGALSLLHVLTLPMMLSDGLIVELSALNALIAKQDRQGKTAL
jgi:hypothetical protein